MTTPTPPPGFRIVGQTTPEPPPGFRIVGQPSAGFSARSLPTVGGAMGFSDEFRGATGAGNMQAIKPVLSDLFGNYEDVAKALQTVAPGAKLVRDDEGMEVLELPNGQRFAMNKPGVQGHEVAATAARTLGFLPVARGVQGLAGLAKAIPGIGKFMPTAATLGGRMGLGAAAGGVGDVGMQKLAGRDEIDKGQTALASGFGAAGELVAPIVGALRGKPSDATLLKAGRDIAARFQLTDLPETALRKLGAMAPQIGAGMPKEAVIAELVTGVRPMRGQMPGAFDEASTLERLKSTAFDPAASVVRNTMDAQFAGLSRYGDDLIKGISGGKPTAAEGTQAVAGQIGIRAASLDDAINAAYTSARSGKAFIPDDIARGLPKHLEVAIADAAVDLPTSPITARALTLAKERFGEAKTAADVVKHFESLRKQFGGLYSSTMSDADKRGLTVAKRALDGWLDDALVKGVITGDEGVISSLKQGRELRARFGQLFESRGPGDAGGKWIEQALSGKSVDELAQAVYGAGQVSPKAAAQIAKRVRDAAGPGDAWNQMRGAFINRLISNQRGETAGYDAIATNLKRFLREQPELAGTLFSGKERDAMGKLANAADFLRPKGDFARSSGTAERLARMTSSIPILGTLVGAIRGPAQVAQAFRQTTLPGARPPNLAAAAALGQTVQGSSQRPRPYR